MELYGLSEVNSLLVDFPYKFHTDMKLGKLK